VDKYLQQICSGNMLSGEAVRQLAEAGFAMIPGPLSGDRFNQLATTYDELMAAASGPDFKIASTTTRMSDLLSYSSVFDDVFLYAPLLEACRHVIGKPFKLSSFLARTLRAGTPAQELHADLPRDSDDAPLLGFILMIDPFRKDNGATRFIPTSHLWPDLPGDRLSNTRTIYPGEILGCGDPGTMILFNGAIWHSHTANVTPHPRRSIQGYFVRRNARRIRLPQPLASRGP
jgi:ectoine hydroxylase-related dioxygenase (phytanoyl-CoA dioxygenase family)